MKNTIVKTLVYDKQVRLFFVDNTKLINDIFNQNNITDKVRKLIMGKAISIVSLISGTLKGDQRISFQITMSNPKHKVFADADANGNVRGFLSDELLSDPLNCSNNVSIKDLIDNNGNIRVIKGSAMNQFTGITDMPYRNIVDDISHYFIQSEQVQTYLKANIVLDNDDHLQISNAVYAQLLPGASPYLLDKVCKILSTNQVFMNKLGGLSTDTLENRLRELFGSAKVIGESPVQFFCGCSKEMFYGMLHALSENELKQAINEKEPIDTVCQICGRTYSFNESEIQSIL